MCRGRQLVFLYTEGEKATMRLTSSGLKVSVMVILSGFSYFEQFIQCQYFSKGIKVAQNSFVIF